MIKLAMLGRIGAHPQPLLAREMFCHLGLPDSAARSAEWDLFSSGWRIALPCRVARGLLLIGPYRAKR